MSGETPQQSFTQLQKLYFHKTRPFPGNIRRYPPSPRPKYHNTNVRKIELKDDPDGEKTMEPHRRARGRHADPGDQNRRPGRPGDVRSSWPTAKPKRSNSVPQHIPRRKLPPMPRPAYNPDVAKYPMYPEYQERRPRVQSMPHVEVPRPPKSQYYPQPKYSGPPPPMKYYVEEVPISFANKAEQDAFFLSDTASYDSTIAATEGSEGYARGKRRQGDAGAAGAAGAAGRRHGQGEQLVAGMRRPNGRGTCGSLNGHFILSIWGFIKVLQIICSLILLVCAIVELDNWALSVWIVLVALIAVALSSGTLAFHLLRGHLKERRPLLFVEFGLYLFVTLALLSVAILATLQNTTSDSVTCITIVGFLATLLFGIDTVITGANIGRRTLV